MSSKPLPAPAPPHTAVSFFKPHLNEASLRLRNASLGLITLLLLTSLLPVPSLWRAWDIVSGEASIRGDLSTSVWERTLCITGTCSVRACPSLH
jgi:hypothetical protein